MKFCVCASFIFCFENGIWDLIVVIPDSCLSIYSNTSVARTLVARVPRLIRTRSRVPRKNPTAADLGFLGWFSFLYLKCYIVCVLIKIASMRRF